MMSSETKRIYVDSKNRLVISHETAIAPYGREKRLRRIVLDGVWSLTPEHDLKLRLLGKESSFYGKAVILRGELKKASGTGLVFRVRQCDAVSGLRTQLVELKGKWRADGNNRVTFKAAKGRGRYDVLRFQGAWQLNKRNELVYAYSKTVLKTKTGRDVTLVFKGHWEVGAGRVVYRLERSNDSFFSFKAALQSRSLRAAEGAIKYQVGIRYSRGKVYRRVKRVVTIYGVWKLARDLSAAFEVDCSGGKRQRLRFTAERLFSRNDRVSVLLKNEKGKGPGFEVSFSKAFNNDAELFLSLGRFASESRVMGGMRVKF